MRNPIDDLIAGVVAVILTILSIFIFIIVGAGVMYCVFGLFTWISTWPWELVTIN